jgi:glycosyltransferase involved in cell wall biosynthesis
MEMDTSMITIIIPTYRRPHSLEKAIKSALSQTIKEIQVFVCDNASGDETAQMVVELRKSDPRLHYFCHEQNRGMTANYAFGISLVTTEYFSFLSDDDILLPDFCETVLKEFARHPDIAFAAASTLIISPDYVLLADPISKWSREGYFSPPEGLLEMIGKYPPPNAVLFCTERVKSIPIDHQNTAMWDCDFLLNIAAQYPIAIKKHPAALFFSHENSFSHHLSHEKWILASQKLLHNAQQFSGICEEMKRQITSAFTRQITTYAVQGLIHSCIKKDDVSATIYSCFLYRYRRNLTRKNRIYWTLCRMRQALPFFSRFLRLALRIKERQRRKIVL